jgi:hypothetical protein
MAQLTLDAIEREGEEALCLAVMVLDVSKMNSYLSQFVII